MKLYCDGRLFGILTGYTYETPWAWASIKPVDAAAYAALCQAGYFLNVVLEEEWGDLSAEEERQEYDRRLAQLGLTEKVIDRFRTSRWEVREADHPDRQGLITLYDCEPDGWLRWRW